MAQVRVRWLQRVNGRFPGDEETVERTDYIDALVGQKRLEILGGPFNTGPAEPIVAVFTNGFADEPVLDETTNDLDQKLADQPAPKPKPRPRTTPKALAALYEANEKSE